MIHIMGGHQSKLTNVQPEDVQPNACDLRLGKVFSIKPETFVLSEQSKSHRGSEELIPDFFGYWNLEPGSYEVIMENVITVGEGEAGWVITRSTLNRNGVFITSGLYDSGYEGVMAGVMHVHGGVFSIQKGTRVAQFILFKAECLHKYDGSYGLGKTHDNKYGV